MDDELKTARAISERMLKVHNERDFDLDWHKERADQLSERWHNIHSQIDSRSVPVAPSLKNIVFVFARLARLELFKKKNKTLQASRPGRNQQISAALPRLVQRPR